MLIRRAGSRVADVAAFGRDATTTTILVDRVDQRMAFDPVAAQEIDRLTKWMEVRA